MKEKICLKQAETPWTFHGKTYKNSFWWHTQICRCYFAAPAMLVFDYSVTLMICSTLHISLAH